MKIVNRNDFLALPNGILFRKYDPCIFQDLQIKTESQGDDFVCLSFDWVKTDNHRQQDEFEILKKAKDNGESFEFDYRTTYRDGMYEDEWFAVYEKEDIYELSQIFIHLVNNYPETFKANK